MPENGFSKYGLGPRTVHELEEETRFLKGERKVSEFITAIKGRKEIPLKFEYLGKGADRYEKVTLASVYADSYQEAPLIDAALHSLLGIVRSNRVNLMYVGCGNGTKAIPALKAFGKTHQPLNYALLDISPAMLLKAYNNTRKLYRGSIIIRNFEWDFEEGNFAYVTDYMRKNGEPVNVIFFLGGTIGNLSDRARILANFRESMSLSDYLVITFLMLPRNVDGLVQVYANNLLADAWVVTALNEIGVDKNCGSVKISFNRKKQQVEIYFIISRDVVGRVEDREIHLRKGQKVLLGTSHKFTRSEIRNLLNLSGFRIVWSRVNKGSTMATVICQPRSL